MIKYKEPIYAIDVQPGEDENIAEVRRVLKIINGTYNIQMDAVDKEIILKIPSNINHE